MSKVVIIIEATQLGSIKATEITEIIMLLSSFNLKPNIIFRGSSIWLLNKLQQAEQIEQNSVAANWQTLAMFELKLYVEQSTFETSGLKPKDLNQAVTLIEQSDINTMIEQSTFTWVL